MEQQKITKVLKNSLRNNSETAKNENDQETSKGIPKERYISRRKKIIDYLGINIKV